MELRSPPHGRPDISGARRAALAALFTGLFLLGLPGEGIHAQQTGTVTGTVVNAQTQQPMAQAQVYMVGTGLGALTNQQGRFVILNVPAGSYTLRAERIGFQTQNAQVDVSAGESVVVDFAMPTEALGLDEIIVTGEAGQARRREVGNSISQINMGTVEEPSANFENLLQGRVAGLVMTDVSAGAGSGKMIRLRGNNSVAQSNQPLIYIDGVRVRSEAYPKNVPPVGYSGRSGNIQASPLNDINPEDIERIEVIKGAAATTLYGTEASAGVIQIFTKRGQQGGGAQWTGEIRQSVDHVQAYGSEGEPKIYMEPWLRNSHGQEYSLSVRGGLETVTYFLSGNFGDDKAPLPNDRDQSVNLRGNVGFSPMPDLNISWNTAFTSHDIDNTPSGDNAQGVTLNAWRQETNYTGPNPTINDAIDRLLEYDISTQIRHLNTGLTVRHSPGAFNQRLTVGYDQAYSEGRQVREFGFILAPGGIMSNQRFTAETITLDYSANYDLELTDIIDLTVSAGGQTVSEEETSTTGYARDFPGPSKPTLSSGSVTLAFEDRIKEINAGFFFQGRFGVWDRLFVTTGVRIDGNSAFGEGLGLQAYPKVSGSYVISDEDFWDEEWGSLKLRAAYGQAGRAPGAFDAVRTWSPTRYGSTPGFIPDNRGNPDLGPERTKEIEVGFDASTLDDRVTAEFTFYNQTTDDALFPVRTVPTEGGWENQLENVGKIRNRGIELAVNGEIVRQRDWGWELGLITYTNNSEVLDLGEAVSFSVNGEGWVTEGQPAPVLRGPRVSNPNELADPEYEEGFLWGPTQPTLTLTPTTQVRMPYGISLSARGEFLGGHYINDSNTEGKISRGQTSWPSCIEEAEMVAAGQIDQLTAAQRNRCVSTFVRDASLVNKGDFFKLRDVTLTTPLDFAVPAQYNAVLTLSARNAWKWLNDDWEVLDPELGCNTGHDCLVINQQEHIPPPATFVASVRFQF
ncbi:MAG: TonB-dependent receptor [Gemmatimonadetes bacterium]|nr:TonB-dependent receptor [Gemmatimonadota bacterium]NIU37638.1 TonB-dependent receptor [Gemmatimonadota bacterium]NIW66407.1 TonB-dependent receptor [Gemmatimonadota bacterium]